MCQLSSPGLILRLLLWSLSWALVASIGPQSNQGDRAARSPSIPVTNLHAHSSATPITPDLGPATCPSPLDNYIASSFLKQCSKIDAQNRALGSHDSNIADAGRPHSSPASDDVAVAATETIHAAKAKALLGERFSAESSTGSLETDSASPLDNAKFLSFEEWKKQNLAKSGQNVEDMKQARNAGGVKQRPSISNALDSYGEEGEINLDFAGFGGAGTSAKPQSQGRDSTTSPEELPSASPSATQRSKDVGKTCEERTNYASFDCAATVLKTNPGSKSASRILVEHKDSYMLNTCSVNNKFFIVEMCEEILVDTVVLANFEFFSSSFRHFRVSVSDRYPVKADKWRALGTFEARNLREIQAFAVEKPQIWARYLRVELLSHYGNEYYCPVSLLRIHGTTMMEDYRSQEDVSRGDGEEEAATEVDGITTDDQPVDTPSLNDEAEPPVESSTGVSTANAKQTQVPSASKRPPDANTESCAPVEYCESMHELNAKLVTPQLTCGPAYYTCSPESDAFRGSVLSNVASRYRTDEELSSDSEAAAAIQTEILSVNTSISSETLKASTSAKPGAGYGSENATTVPSAQNPHTSTQLHEKPTNTSTGSNESLNASQIRYTQSTHSPSLDAARSQTNSTRTVNTPNPPQPSTQESFFKSVHKRLQQLESNSSLSLQYIESQSLLLREAFSKVEKRQISTATSFLSNLNQTVMAELRGFRDLYDELWQTTVLELQGQRDQHQREMLAMSSRLSIVADELVWQKRVGIAQSTLLLLCLALVFFARQPGSNSGYIEMPTVQSVMNRSSAALGWESPSSRSPVSVFRRKVMRSPSPASPIEDLPDSREGGMEVMVEPPTPSPIQSIETPERDAAGSHYHDGGVNDAGDLEAEGLGVEADEPGMARSQSEPATPLASRDLDDSEDWDPGVWRQSQS